MEKFTFAGFEFPRRIPRLVPLVYCGAGAYAPLIARRDIERAHYEAQRKAGAFVNGTAGADYRRRIDGMLPRFKVDTAYRALPKPLTPGAAGLGWYLDSDFAPGLRWQWCDKVEGVGIRHEGWFTDPDGCGDTIRGLVLRLPHGRGFLAGTSLGLGMSAGADREIYADEVRAAYAADRMAEREAETEREYQEAWRAGTDAREADGESRETRRELLALMRDMRAAARNLAGEAGAALCARLRADVRELVRDVRKARAKRDKLRREWAGSPGFADGYGEG